MQFKLCRRGSCCPNLSVENDNGIVYCTLTDDYGGKISFTTTTKLAIGVSHIEAAQPYFVIPVGYYSLFQIVYLSELEIGLLFEKLSQVLKLPEVGTVNNVAISGNAENIGKVICKEMEKNDGKLITFEFKQCRATMASVRT